MCFFNTKACESILGDPQKKLSTVKMSIIGPFNPILILSHGRQKKKIIKKCFITLYFMKSPDVIGWEATFYSVSWRSHNYSQADESLLRSAICNHTQLFLWYRLAGKLYPFGSGTSLLEKKPNAWWLPSVSESWGNGGQTINYGRVCLHCRGCADCIFIYCQQKRFAVLFYCSGWKGKEKDVFILYF